MRRVILLVWVLGCGGGDGSAVESGSGGAPPAATGGTSAASGQGGAVATGGSAGGGGASTGGASGGTSGTGGSAGSGTGGAEIGGVSGTGGAGTPPDAGSTAPLSCPQAQGFQATLCGYPGPQLVTWVGRWKDGFECAVCTSVTGQHTGCTAAKEGRTTEGPGPLGCVGSCSQCCYRKANSPCASDADCCSPLRCQTGDAGGKSCR